jgi:hypothetical protein
MPHPDADAVAAFNTLAGRALSAGGVGRYALCAELASRAAADAERLYGSASVIAAELHGSAARCLHNRAALERVADRMSFSVSGFEALLRAIGHLAPRLRDGTLRDGACRAEEAAFWKKILVPSTSSSPASPAQEAALGSACGYITALTAAMAALVFVAVRRWPERLHAEQHVAQSFILDVLGFMEVAALDERAQKPFECEIQLVATLDRLRQEQLEPAFAQALFARWRGAPLVAVRHRRLLLQPAGVMSKAARSTLAYEAERRAADIAKRGLRACALPGCGAVETSVKEFKLCGA